MSLNDSNPIEKIISSITNQKDITVKIICIQLHDGTWVDERFYNRILLQIQEIVPVVDPDCVYTTSQLCGEAFWDILEKGDRIKAGKCVAQMVACKDLPLRFARTSKSNSRLYQLK